MSCDRNGIDHELRLSPTVAKLLDMELVDMPDRVHMMQFALQLHKANHHSDLERAALPFIYP